MNFKNRYFLDKDRAKISGVCAGIASTHGWDVTIVRILVIIATIWMPFIIGGYILAAWLLDARPREGTAAREAWTRAAMPEDPTAPRYRYSDAKTRFERLEQRLRDLESIVTSREFQMDRELRGTSRS